MKNLIKYIKTYGNLTFEQKSVNDIDILIFSLFSYINFKEELKNKENIKLCDVWEKVSKYNNKPFGFAHATAIKVMKNIYDKNRYCDLILKDYVYYISDDTQFGAITIVTDKYIYISFEGTDDSICGWKEDFELSYIYPTKSQKKAIEYLNNAIKKYRKEVIICGHSKGGNLSLVSAMNLNFFRKNKVKKIYSFDGPGLKKEEFNSFNYKTLKRKLVNIIPNSSFIGVLLNKENLTVVKSKGLGLFQHDPMTWIIERDNFKYTTQDKLSKKFSNSINRWLLKYDYKQRKEIVEGIFSLFEETGIRKTTDIKSKKIKSIYKIIKTSKNMSLETKEVLVTSGKLLLSDFKEELKGDN